MKDYVKDMKDYVSSNGYKNPIEWEHLNQINLFKFLSYLVNLFVVIQPMVFLHP